MLRFFKLPRRKKGPVILAVWGVGTALALLQVPSSNTARPFVPQKRTADLGARAAFLEENAWRSRRESAGQRTIAREGVRCFAERATLEGLRAEVARLERERGESMAGTPSKPAWGIDVSQLPLAQQEFVEHLRAEIPEEASLAQEGCGDIPCALSRRYGDSTGEYGLLLYGWFLETGSIVVTERLHPALSLPLPQGVTLSDFRPTLSDLRTLWKVAGLLPAPLRELRRFSKIYLTPPGWAIDASQFPQTRKLTLEKEVLFQKTQNGARNTRSRVALAKSSSLTSVLFVARSALKAGTENILTAAVARDIVHELAHVWDFEAGDWDGGRHTFFSERFEDGGWASLSWTRELRGSAWELDRATRAFFVSDYARTAPYEDFAESVAYYRTQGDALWTNAPEKARVIQSQLYEGRRFDRESLRRDYLASTPDSLAEKLRRDPEGCAEASRLPELAKKTETLDAGVSPTTPMRLARRYWGEAALQAFALAERNWDSCSRQESLQILGLKRVSPFPRNSREVGAALEACIGGTVVTDIERLIEAHALQLGTPVRTPALRAVLSDWLQGLVLLRYREKLEREVESKG